MDDDKLFEDEGERPRIKVTDRRKFSADGTPRAPEAPADDDREGQRVTGADAGDADAAAAGGEPDAAAPEPASDTASAPETSRSSQAEEETAAAERRAHGPAPAAGEPTRIVTPEPGIGDLPRDFSAFVEGMYLEAMLYLGAIADPRTGQTIEDVELAKYKIDLLGMLEEKTAGNLTAEEGQQLEEVLYQLRMVYLQKTQAAKI